MMKILLIDDDESLLYGMKRSLSKQFEVVTAKDSVSAIKAVQEQNFGLIFLDYKLGEENGLEVLSMLRAQTAHGTTELIIDAIRQGAVDFLTKPVDTAQLISAAEKYGNEGRDGYCSDKYENILSIKYDKSAVIAVSEGMKDVLKSVAIISGTNSPVLITGESGTGKDVTALLMHNYSRRKDNPFVQINCAAIPDNLLESELFGYVKGAFTGAYNSNPGKFQMADKGTIFLDEIGDMPMPLQGKLLQVLQDGRIQRVGDNTFRQVDIRIISATNKNLKELVRTGQFREDLYYRINAFNVDIPPLRDRKKDIWSCCLHFIRIFSVDMGKDICCVDKSAREVLEKYPWHGNIRELKNIMSKAVALSNTAALRADTILNALGKHETKQQDSFFEIFRAKYDENLLSNALEEVEEEIIRKTVAECGENYTAAAKMLGISRVTLYDKIKKYGL
jgi:DNA-binding NtrC family response regulator